MYSRAFICEGDTLHTAAGGQVQTRPRDYPETLHGRSAVYEGDPVYCNTCKSWGVTKCVPPYRGHTNHLGQQANLDGDLCLCKCPTSPRLKALSNKVRQDFEAHEIAQMAGAESWLSHAGHAPIPMTDRAYNDNYRLLDAETGEPLAHCKYTVIRDDGQKEPGESDALGFTHMLSSTRHEEGLRIDLGDWEATNAE